MGVSSCVLEDPSFLEMHVYDQFEKLSSDPNVGTDKIDEDQGKAEKDVGVAQTKERLLRMQLLTALADHIPDVEAVGGARAIPFLQVTVAMETIQ